MTDYIQHPTGQYHKVGTAGRLSLYTSKDNIGTHWLATLDGEVYEQDYYNRPSIKGLRKAIDEWQQVWKGAKDCPFALPEGTPTTWKRYENPAASFNGY